jgi:hypothetical protein
MMTSGQYAQELSQRAHGPHNDKATAEAASLAAETIRYLVYATTHGGLTEPGTVYALLGELSTAAHRLPQLLTQLADWITAGADAGRIAGDRPAGQFASETRATFSKAAGRAADLTAALSDAHNLTATLRASDRAAEGSSLS